MIKSIIKRASTTMLFVICGLMGLIFGSTVAYADTEVRNLSVDTADYISYHNEAYDYEYRVKQTVTMSADKSDVTFVIPLYGGYSTTYYDGDSIDPPYVYFGGTYIYDEYGYHSVYYSGWAFVAVDNCNACYATNWFYGNLNTTNNMVVVDQPIFYLDSPTDNTYTVYVTQGS